jgi:predicted type IV restriction endonuclease
MDIVDSLQQLAVRIPNQLPHLLTEEATKNALIMPFIQALGYNVFDPTEVIPEFTADVGTKKGEKVDYVIKRDNKMIILWECKPVGAKLGLNHASQLYRYFSVTEARFAIFTNGVEYQIYTDIEAANRMDEKPFFEFSMLALDAKAIEEIRKFSKAVFNLENILSTASELKYTKQIQALISKELEAPSDEFVRHFTKQVYSGTITATVKSQFEKLVGNAFREFIKSRVNQRIQSALEPVTATQDESSTALKQTNSDDAVETTPEEVKAFHIVRGLLSKHVSPSRIVMRDTKSYCGILLDDNNRKPICRLRFNAAQKYLSLLDSEKNEVKHPIDEPVDIFKFEKQLLGTLAFYEPAKKES